MTAADVLVRGTAWVGLGAWAACEWLRSRPGAARDRNARACFVGGLLALILHSLFAFHLRYAWSSEAALLDAARRIEAVTGRPSPDGFFANHLFLAWWALEAAAWCVAPARYRRRPAALVWTSRAVFAFMFANGAIVFARDVGRVFGVLALLTAGWAWTRSIGAPRPSTG